MDKKKVIKIVSAIGVVVSIVVGVVLGVGKHRGKKNRAKYTTIQATPPTPKKADLKKFKPM